MARLFYYSANKGTTHLTINAFSRMWADRKLRKLVKNPKEWQFEFYLPHA